MKKLSKLALSAILLTMLASCGSKEETKKEETKKDGLTAGTYTAESDEYNMYNGFKDLVEVVVDEDGKIIEISFEGVDEFGRLKSEAVKEGDYDMTVAGSTKTWIEQMELLGQHIIKTQNINVEYDEETGKTDAISGVTITINEHIDVLSKALN